VKQIPLGGKKGKGLFALVDDEDFEKFGNLNWSVVHGGYAATGVWQRETKTMKRPRLHRLIMDCPEGLEVDHINLDKLDNRKENLRICTKKNNNKNRPKRKDSQSKYKGAFIQKKTGTYKSRISVEGKSIYLGTFKTEEEAAMAYNEAAYIYFGEFAKLNKVIL
jgi:hypothetical protein